ncbi:uncharacterized protein I303_102184 [Kwoniella dejecticola CBS 10117]|uniref:Ribonuclease H1 N-terminal domain-containing protein n=1 Tax=Kwoniella dejecticola CBS 10117 TaxID=1296121 RepID=A0A1A6ABM6_9TREE|nr:uncharacterized protein I303_01676 [Kwoniella dejecticola CBS 10117]OBR87471.1 hypothetical protein I303_01676 [Kwoniella dejecticola CBS 10117]
MASTAMITPSMDPSPPGAYIFSTYLNDDERDLSMTTLELDSEQPLSFSPSDSQTQANPIISNTPFQQTSFSIPTQLPIQSVTSYTVSQSTYRVSRLPPAPTIYQAGPSKSPQRYLFFAVRQGHKAGVYTVWHEAERQIIDYPRPVFKTFSTRLAAQAFVAGWDGAGRHSLPSSTPRPLREHLAMSFPGSVNISTSPAKRQPYHSRLLAPPTSGSNDFSPSPIDTSRPPLNPRHSYHRHSMVKVSSPLRCQVDEEEELAEASGSRLPPLRKAASFMGVGGLLSPPQSPERAQGKPLSPMDRERPHKSRGGEGAPLSSRNHRDFAPPPQNGLGLVARPLSPPHSPVDNKRAASHCGSPSRPSPSRTPSGLWADAVSKPSQSSPLPPDGSGQPEFSDPTAPKFSRSGLRKSGVVMPVAAKRASSSQSLRSKPSLSNLRSNSANSSSSSINSWSDDRRRSSTSSFGSFSSQDRLSKLAETSKKELQLNEEGLLALTSLSPPRAAFMSNTMRRSSSNSSLVSNDSTCSMSSMTSATSSTQTSSLESCEPILEENDDDNIEILLNDEDRDNVISCTKSDGDADGSVGDKESLKSNGTMKKSKKGGSGGGMFKRLAKALKIDKKPERESARRGSL